MKNRKRTIIIKKAILLLILVTILLFVGSSFSFNQINAISYQDSSAWLGADVGVETIHDASYESSYEPFGSIKDNASLIDTNKIYVIENAFDLYQLSINAQGINATSYLSLDYVLGNNIDYFDALKENLNYLFIPIGISQPFTGTFDGQGYEITNLIFRSVNTETDYNQYMSGLVYYSMFSTTSETAEIKNFGLINPLIVQPLDLGLMTFVSPFVGLNKGLVENIYYIDTREASAGINAEGDFIISGLVSVNQGTIRNSYIASPYIKSQAVIQNLASSIITYSNSGTIDHVYFDQEILIDQSSINVYGTGINTADFQNGLLFTTTWYFQDAYYGLTTDINQYPQLKIDKTYPILQGLDVVNNQLQIDSASDLSYMNTLLNISGLFRNATYILVSDIDLKQISRDNYQAAEVSFNGVFTSAVINGNTLYDHTDTGGAENHYSIMNMTITEASFIGDYASYGFFAALFGTVHHINFVNLEINITDMDDVSGVDRVFISGLSGLGNQAVISDVHLDIEISIDPNSTDLGQIYIGSLIGYGSSDINYSTVTGNLNEVLINDTSRMKNNYIGGFIGYATSLDIDHCANALNIIGFSYVNIPDNTTYYGGFSGYIQSLEHIEKIVNVGTITTHKSANVDQIYVGGIIAFQEFLEDNIAYVYQNGDIHVGVYNEMEAYIAGYGFMTNDESTIEIKSLTNNGRIYTESTELFDESILNNINLYMSNILITDGLNGSIKGLFNQHSQILDLSLIDSYATNLLALSQDSLNVEQSYQTGDLSFYTSQTLVNDKIDISANIYGKNLNLNHIRQEGNLDIILTNNSSSSLTNAKLYIHGLALEASQNYKITNAYQGGDITISKEDQYSLSYDLYISGIAYANRNTNLFAELGIDPTSIEIETENGSIDTVMNSGDILVNGDFDGSIKTSGIILYNESMITNAINLGDVSIYSDIITANDQIEAGGIVYAMISQYAQIKDSANNGDIKVSSTSSNGYVHASGIAVRNDVLEDGTNISLNSDHKYAKIIFSMNYGDVYAFNGLNETSFTITDETRSIAAGILGLGLLSIVNNINYGNIYSRYLGSGIIGFVYLSKFDTLNSDEVYISNLINYGKVREVVTYLSATNKFVHNDDNTPPTGLPYAYGAIVGKIHTGTSTWAFSGNVTYPVDVIYFGYLLNFDEKINMFDSAPTLSSNWVNSFSGDLDDANDIIINMVQYMATTNPNDDSVEPFSYFYAGSAWFGQYIGQVISYYDVSTSDEGMFYELFPFRSARPANAGTDQYIKDYIEYIPVEKANETLIDKIETNTTYDYPGIYALSSSSGIQNGIFIPDSFSFEGLNPYLLDEENPDESWIGNTLDTTSVAYAMYDEMRQIKTGFATTIYDMEIIQTDINGNIIDGGLTLKNPVIDQERRMVTYYLPSNALVLGNQSAESLTVSRYIEVEDSYILGARRVANLLTSDNSLNGYTLVGTHKKVGNNMVTIGPYASNGVYNLSTYDSQPYDSSSRNTPVYDLTQATDSLNATTQVFTHEPHVRTTFLWWTYWNATGYRVQRSTTSAGYGAYESFSLSGYPTLYKYVGPNTEPVTYVSQNSSGVTVYDSSSVFFKANTDESTYTISDTASLSYEGESITSLISIPRSYGVYDSMYTTGGTYIDSVEDHYGNVRVYSEEYSVSDSSTYQDYEIRIIRTADESISDILALNINGTNSLPWTYDVNNVTATNDLYYETSDNNGIIKLTYETYNISDLYYLNSLIEVFDHNTGVKIHTSLYKLSNGIVSTETGFSNESGEWGIGSATIKFEADDQLPSGDYYLLLTLVSGQTYQMNFSKIESANASVLSITYQGEVLNIIDNSYTSYIDYGLIYESGNTDTECVNFSNLTSIVNVYYSELESTSPFYLDNIEISTFATIAYIDFNMTMIDGYRHQYEITYHLIAEDGSTNQFTHYLLEYPVNTSESNIYKNGGSLNLPLTEIIVYYQESPTIRIGYEFDHVFFENTDILTINSSFIPIDSGDVATEDEDYFINKIINVGYEIDLNQTTPKGTYTFVLSYQKSYIINGVMANWNITFDTITIQKVKNDNSHLENVLFATESVFDEVLDSLVTIIDINEVTPTEYLGYFDSQNPTSRIISVLPTTGLDYGDYSLNTEYWIIGQVQATDLTGYMPTFYIPDNASIYRVIDENNIDYSFQSSNLAADFTDFGTGETLNYVHYRIYAEDYNENPSHYTDYYVAVQDSTNNIKFDITVVNDTDAIIERVYLMVNVYQFASDYEGELMFSDIRIQMSMFSYYNQTTDNYHNNQFETSMYGFYVLHVDLPEGYDAVIEFEQSYITELIYLESSRIPRRYYVTVHIVEETPGSPNWGYQAIFDYRPSAEPLEFGHTYTEGQYFEYNDIIWEVVDPTYIYDPSNPPGTGSWQGLKDISEIYNVASVYEIGDVVLYQDLYYIAIASNASNVNPLSGLGQAWNEISEEWLTYNLYTTGDIVLYNGVYYISTQSWNKGWAPDVTTWAWQVYTP